MVCRWLKVSLVCVGLCSASQILLLSSFESFPRTFIPKRFGSRGIKYSGWVSDWVCDFSLWASSAMEAVKETKFGTNVALGMRMMPDFYFDEDMQRKRTVPHSTMKNNRNIIECCNNTHQGAPHTSKQTGACASDLRDGSHVTCVCVFVNSSVAVSAGNRLSSLHSRINMTPVFSAIVTLSHCLMPFRCLYLRTYSEDRSSYCTAVTVRVRQILTTAKDHTKKTSEEFICRCCGDLTNVSSVRSFLVASTASLFRS